MSKILTISDETYQNLEDLARLRGFKTIEQFLEEDEQLFDRRHELARRRQIGREIKEFQQRMREKYGVMPDSAELVREDRAR